MGGKRNISRWSVLSRSPPIHLYSAWNAKEISQPVFTNFDGKATWATEETDFSNNLDHITLNGSASITVRWGQVIPDVTVIFYALIGKGL